MLGFINSLVIKLVGSLFKVNKWFYNISLGLERNNYFKKIFFLDYKVRMIVESFIINIESIGILTGEFDEYK